MRKWLFIPLFFLFCGACSGPQKIQVAESGPVPPKPVVAQSNVRSAPSNPRAYYYFILSQLQLREGKLEEGTSSLKEAIKYDPKEPSLHVQLARLYVFTGSLNEAVEECKLALAHDPHSLSAYLLLGGIYTSLKKTKLAIESYQKAIEMDPTNRESYLYLSSLYSDTKEYEKAIQALESFLKIEPNSSMGLYSLGRIYVEKKSYQKASEYFLKSLAVEPNEITVLMDLGIIYEILNEPEKAIESYKRILSLDPDNKRARNRLGQVFIKEKMSNINGGVTDKDGNGYISRLTPDGRVVNAKWATGLNGPKGLRGVGSTLWAADIDEVVGIEIASGRITSRVKIDGASFLNDLATAPDGTRLRLRFDEGAHLHGEGRQGLNLRRGRGPHRDAEWRAR